MQGGGELLLQPLRAAAPGLRRERRGVVRELRDELALLGRGTLEAGAVAARDELLLCLAKLLPRGEQLSTSFLRLRTSWFSAQAASVGFRSALTSFASSRSLSARRRLTSASRASVKSAGARP